MASIAEGHARLSGTLVGAILQVDDALRSPELLLGEVTDILLRLFWANGRLSKLRSLKHKKIKKSLHLSLSCPITLSSTISTDLSFILILFIMN